MRRYSERNGSDNIKIDRQEVSVFTFEASVTHGRL